MEGRKTSDIFFEVQVENGRNVIVAFAETGMLEALGVRSIRLH